MCVHYEMLGWFFFVHTRNMQIVTGGWVWGATGSIFFFRGYEKKLVVTTVKKCDGYITKRKNGLQVDCSLKMAVNLIQVGRLNNQNFFENFLFN